MAVELNTIVTQKFSVLYSYNIAGYATQVYTLLNSYLFKCLKAVKSTHEWKNRVPSLGLY